MPDFVHFEILFGVIPHISTGCQYGKFEAQVLWPKFTKYLIELFIYICMKFEFVFASSEKMASYLGYKNDFDPKNLSYSHSLNCTFFRCKLLINR